MIQDLLVATVVCRNNSLLSNLCNSSICKNIASTKGAMFYLLKGFIICLSISIKRSLAVGTLFSAKILYRL